MTENWGEAEHARVIRFEIQPDFVSVQFETAAQANPPALRIRCVLYEREKTLSVFQVISLLARLCEREFSEEEMDIIRGDLRIYSFLTISGEKKP